MWFAVPSLCHLRYPVCWACCCSLLWLVLLGCHWLEPRPRSFPHSLLPSHVPQLDHSSLTVAATRRNVVRSQARGIVEGGRRLRGRGRPRGRSCKGARDESCQLWVHQQKMSRRRITERRQKRERDPAREREMESMHVRDPRRHSSKMRRGKERGRGGKREGTPHRKGRSQRRPLA